jgi:hypothetical protein
MKPNLLYLHCFVYSAEKPLCVVQNRIYAHVAERLRMPRLHVLNADTNHDLCLCCCSSDSKGSKT